MKMMPTETSIPEKIEEWIDNTLLSFSNDKVCCECLTPYFNGFYPPGFLKESFFVVVDALPKPDFPELQKVGLGDFIDTDFNGITYKNHYFIRMGHHEDFGLHFHELVHVFQWRFLGAQSFIRRYVDEYLKYGYEKAPLEVMAYALESHYRSKGKAFDVPQYIQRCL